MHWGAKTSIVRSGIRVQLSTTVTLIVAVVMTYNFARLNEDKTVFPMPKDMKLPNYTALVQNKVYLVPVLCT